MPKPADKAQSEHTADRKPDPEEPVELQDELHRVLFDHEMERGTTTTRIPQPRRRRRLLRE